MPTNFNFIGLPQFTTEFKRLTRKYKSLPQDLENFKKVLAFDPLGNSKHFHVLARERGSVVVKARFFCRYLKGSSLRVVYIFIQERKQIEFLELYFKGHKENEDRTRIKDYLSRQLLESH